MTSCTLASASMAKPVWRQAITSEWSPKMFRAWAATVRADTWKTRGQQLAGDLVHVGDHQQQALGCGVGGGQSARRQRAVDSAGGTGLRLHFDDLDGGAEDVFLALGRPLVHIVGHGAGRGGGVAPDLRPPARGRGGPPGLPLRG